MPDDHDHDHSHDHHAMPADTALRVKALETALTRAGHVDPATLDAIVDAYENRIGPQNGARVIARAWTDPAYKARLLENGSAAIEEMDLAGIEGTDIQVVENAPGLHNLVVCTLCSCYPWPMLGLPPSWYKSFAYRSRAVSEPRAVLAEFGLELPDDTEVRVWDSTAERRYLVMPQQPPDSVGEDAATLAARITRNGMIGTALI